MGLAWRLILLYPTFIARRERDSRAKGGGSGLPSRPNRAPRIIAMTLTRAFFAILDIRVAFVPSWTSRMDPPYNSSTNRLASRRPHHARRDDGTLPLDCSRVLPGRSDRPRRADPARDQAPASRWHYPGLGDDPGGVACRRGDPL